MAPEGGAAAVVCCMCGDHGLPRELFRCSLCRLRLQHRYCSDLYPRAAAYRSCNWCLRDSVREEEEAEPGADGSPVKARKTPAKRSPATDDSSRADDHDDPAAADVKSKSRPAECCDDDGGCSRSAFSADPGKPVKKKPNKNSETIVRSAQGPARRTPAAASKGRREAMRDDRAGRKARPRVKVRRYKLLTEVIC